MQSRQSPALNHHAASTSYFDEQEESDFNNLTRLEAVKEQENSARHARETQMISTLCSFSK